MPTYIRNVLTALFSAPVAASILATLLATSLEWPALEAFGLADSFDLPASASSLNQMGRTVELAGIHYYIVSLD